MTLSDEKLEKLPIVQEDDNLKKPLESELDLQPKLDAKKLILSKVEHFDVETPQHPEKIENIQFTKVKLKKSIQKPKPEPTSTVTLPKFQLKSRIKIIDDWPPKELKPILTNLGSIRQNGEISRNVKEAAKVKRKPVKISLIPEAEKTTLEKPDIFPDTIKTEKTKADENLKPSEITYEENDVELKQAKPKVKPAIDMPDATEKVTPIKKDLEEKSQKIDEPLTSIESEKEITDKIFDKKPTKKHPKLIPLQIESKTFEPSEPQFVDSTEGPVFKKLKLKKTVAPLKQDTSSVTLPKFQLKSRIKFVSDWPPTVTKPIITTIGSIRQNGILSRNVKEAAKLKKEVIPTPKLPEIHHTPLEKTMFDSEDIKLSIEAKHEKESTENIHDTMNIATTETEPEQFTIKPKRPSLKKVQEITDEVTIKKTLKPVRKPSIPQADDAEPEIVTFRPKTTKTKEDVEQEFNIHLDSYAEEEISMSSKVKLKPQRIPTFDEAANETSIQFYEETEAEGMVEIVETEENVRDEMADITIPFKKQPEYIRTNEDEVTSKVFKPKTETEITQDVNITLDKKPKYTVHDQEGVTFDVKSRTEKVTSEDVSLSSNVIIKPKMKTTHAEGSAETSIKVTQEFEDNSQIEEIIVSDVESEENVEMVIRPKGKKPNYEISEVEEVNVELKPKKPKNVLYEEENLTFSTKRTPRKPLEIQEADASMSIAREQEFPETPVNVRRGDTVFAVYSYVAETDDAINLVEGERLYILETTNQDWWFVRKHLTEETGWVPAQYLMDEPNYTSYLQKKLNEKIDKLPVFEKPTSEEQAIAPIFVEKLRPKHTPDGSTVQFECQVEGYPRPQITWFRQTAIIKPSQDFQMYYDDDNVATLIIREVFPEDAGTFTCVAKNAAGFASSTTELTVEAPLSDHGSEMTILSRKSLSRESSLADILEGIPPTFSKRPKAQYVEEGSNILLECRLVAIPEPDIVWLFKGEEVVPNENISIVTESDMHLYCSVLKITNVKKHQEGTYTVVAVNREGEANLPIVLKIKTGQKEKPQVIEPLKNMSIREGESFVLTVQVVGNPKPKVTWYKNNEPIKSDVCKTDGDIHTITVIKPRKGINDGIYTLKAKNTEGSTQTSAVITIEEPTEEDAEPPLFIHRFQEITVNEKGTIKLFAKVTGNPVPTITWYRNNKVITPSDTITQTFDGENIELIIRNVDSEIDSGDYKCVASNSAGKASHGARVTIDVDKVVFVKNLHKSYEVEEGKLVILECETSHTVSTKWYHNNKELSGMDHREIIQESRIHKLKIKKTKLTDTGRIKCIVKDQETSTHLIVHETTPEFIRKLQDFEVKEKDVAILEVEINSETADVLWEKEGKVIKPKKNKYDFEKRGNVRKLFIRNTSVHDEGEYTCILRDDSCTAEVTVVELPPEIISRLTDQRVNKGNKATFEIELTKGDALVQWYKDDMEIQFSNHIQLTIDGKKQKLKIYDCEESDGGKYTCVVGNDKCTATLTVETPSIDFTMRLPEFIIVPAYADAYLTVEIPDDQYDVTWLRRKNKIEDSEKFTLISDGKKRTVIIRKCLEEDQGEYSCLLLDAMCSTKLKVEVTEFSPKILDYIKEYKIKKGSDVTISVSYEAVPKPNDEWIVNSKIIKRTKHTKPFIDSNNASLTIKKVDNTDAGIYKLRLENNCGKADVDINVVITDIPSPPGKPNVLEVDDSSINIFWDEPKSNGFSVVTCYIVEYQERNTSEWLSIENITKTQVYIKNLKVDTYYRFRVFAVNEVGVSESSECSEFILIKKKVSKQAPSVEKPLKDVIGNPNEDVELTCIFGGMPQPKVTWFKDGKKIITSKSTYVNRVATLIISVEEKSQGEYKCVAVNDYGEVETSCIIEVQQKPIIHITENERSQKLRVNDKWSVTATIDGIPKPQIVWYRNGSKIDDSSDIQKTINDNVSVINIPKVERLHSAKYTIEAYNNAGSTSYDVTLSVYDVPSKPEGPVVMKEISKESVTIQWKPPLDDGGLDITKYAVEKYDPEMRQWLKVADVDKEVTSYCFQGLNENNSYKFRIMAINPIGVSEALESEVIVIKTALDVPSPPLGPLGIYGITSDSVTISWSPSERNGGSAILDYTVEIKDGKKWKQIATVTNTTAKIEKLCANVTYKLRIYARNEIGVSLPYIPEQEITIGKTLSPPSQPLIVVVREITSRSVTLSWMAPESDGGSVITNYIIEYTTANRKSWSKIITVNGSTYEHCIENIREKEDLIFRISAENIIGISLPTESELVHLEKHATVPSPPIGPLEIRTVGNNIVMTSWGTPEWDGGAPLLGYNIAIRDVTKTMWMEVGKVDSQTLKFNIKDLSENHTYMIRIYARNEIGISEPLESDEPFKVIPGEDSYADEEPGEQTEMTEPTSFSTQTTTSWLREHNMDADIRSYARGSLLRRDEYFFRIWYYAKQLFK